MKINGVDARLVIDTGAVHSLLDEDAAKRLGLRLSMGAPNVRLRGVGGDADWSVGATRSFSIAGVDLKRVEFVVSPRAVEPGVDGLLGENVLGGVDAEFDLPDGMVHLWTASDCEKSLLAYWAKPEAVRSIKIERIEDPIRRIVGTVLVNGTRVRALFDTGAARSVISRRAAERAGIHPGDPGVIAAGLQRGIGPAANETWIAPVKSIEIGDEKILNTRMLIADFEMPGEDMLIGADFFLSHRVYVARSLSRIDFTYAGGPVFVVDGPAARSSATGGAPAAAPAGDDPDELGRSGAAALSRRAYDQAIADYTRLIALRPDDADAYLQRAKARRGAGQPELARSDLEAAIRLRPANPEALLMRGELRSASLDRDAAVSDIQAAAKAAPDDLGVRVRAAAALVRLQQFPAAVALLDEWVADHPRSERIEDAIAARCDVRTAWGQQLDLALADCDRAVRREHSSITLSTRGNLHLRRGELKAALSDYEAALRLQPKLASALYGRALVRQQLGLTATP